MTTGMLLDTTIQTAASTSGPRFRPYASPDHHVTKGRYITSNDPRGYIPVYEYPLNGQWIMMDIDDGYILWTGIWKALGNSKADIVKMIDSQPDLAPLIRRVRGGYLKIQGTWMPYEVALKLSRRVAWAIRDDLIPLFGPTFPSTCLSPDQPGYGQVVASSQNRRRARRSTQASTAVPYAPRDTHPSWTVVTPPTGPGTPHDASPLPSLPISDHAMSPQYSPHLLHRHSSHTHEKATSPSASVNHPHRYAPYMGSPPNRHSTSISKGGLSLDIPSTRDHLSPQMKEKSFTLPPVHLPDHNMDNSPYALPPISALEDLRGVHTQDSAAVLRRLRLDDEHYPKSGCPTEEQLWARRHSEPTHAYVKEPEGTSRFQPYHGSRSYQGHTNHQAWPPSEKSDIRRAREHFVPSDATHECDSNSDPSPTTPATPESVLSAKGARSTFSDSQKSPRITEQRTFFPRNAEHPDHSTTWSSVRRNSCDIDRDINPTRPHRPW
ncbi:hypothetical protein K443DRAFT_674800 [Laccaria amethystina LaAM-08-1]|uniref:Unplaced genomic scaffold K443scaffold_21, whole genome shotgun sequence n=1 Tax=Laccaria amethystina LaAM-08-1 TaxID=1095629 RepID=A0A0C9Y745_9AGAR|nr:hypothetical protein K443DRAFT_674800 [Laccaria amethystina LaAM-08-1]